MMVMAGPYCSPEDKDGDAKGELLREAVAALMLAGPEINADGVNQAALWALYDCIFTILEHMGAEGLPTRERTAEDV